MGLGFSVLGKGFGHTLALVLQSDSECLSRRRAQIAPVRERAAAPPPPEDEIKYVIKEARTP